MKQQLAVKSRIERDDMNGTEVKAEEVESPVGEDTSGDSKSNAAGSNSNGRGRRLSVSFRTLAWSSVVFVLSVAVGVMTWLYLGVRAEFGDQSRQIANERRAEQTALDYAVNAAVMDYKDLGPWKQKLVAGTTSELGEKLTKAADAMAQIVLPLQWTSSAKPIAAKVRTVDKGVFVVDAFVSVMTKTVQAADSLQSTATYSVTINSNDSWHITDVGGIGTVTGNK